MKNGKLTIEKIKKNYTEIDRNAYGYKMYEHNYYGEERIIVLTPHNTYCYTIENLSYTMRNHNEFEWYKLSE